MNNEIERKIREQQQAMMVQQQQRKAAEAENERQANLAREAREAELQRQENRDPKNREPIRKIAEAMEYRELNAAIVPLRLTICGHPKRNFFHIRDPIKVR